MNKKRKKRFYPNLVKAVVEAMVLIFEEGQQSDRVVRSVLQQNKKWGSRDRRFVSSSIYDMVRWYRLLYEVVGHPPKGIADWWKLFAVLQIWQGEELPPWQEFEELDKEWIKEQLGTVQTNPAVRTAFPDWLSQKIRDAYGKSGDTLLSQLNVPAPLVIRVNTLKTTKISLQKAFEKEGIITEALDGDALLIPERKKLTHLSVFRQGWFEIQDYSSQLVAPRLGVQPGMTVIDACAGAGGKTLHIAALMQNSGRIIAMDVSRRKLEELQKRASRAGVTIIETHLIHPEEDFSEFIEAADRLLLDVPCSGTGTIRRSPDIKWKLKEEHLSKHILEQQSILDNYPTMLKPTGAMLYATCSILPEENTLQIDRFIAKNPSFSLSMERQILPDGIGDGFFLGLLRKN